MALLLRTVARRSGSTGICSILVAKQSAATPGWEVTMSMSLLHRTTGVILASGVYGFGLAMLAAPANYAHYVNAVQALHVSPVLLFAAKFVLAFPLIFHMCSGMRHLIWDLGQGFSIKSVTATGFAASAVAVALTTVVASL